MPDSPNFRPSSLLSFASTATNMSQSSSGSSFPIDDDVLSDDVFGAPDESHNDTSIDDDDSVLVHFPSSTSASTGTTLSHSGSLSSFPDLSGEPPTSTAPKDSQQQSQRSAEDNRQLLALHSSTHLSLCIKHLLVAHRLSTAWLPTIQTLTQQAVSNVRPDVRKGDLMDIRYYVHTQAIPGGRREDSAYVDGVAFQHSLPTPSTMARYSIDNARVLLFAGAIEPPSRPAAESRLFSSLIADSAERDAERHYLDKRLPSVLFLRPDIIFVERSVSRYAQEAMRAAGVSLVTGVELVMLERIARCTRATVLNGLDDVDGRYLGMCGQVRVEEYGIAIDESERDDEQTAQPAQQQQQPKPKQQPIEIELSDLFSGTTVKQPPSSNSLQPPSNSFDPFGGLLGSSPPPPSMDALTSTSPANMASILGSSFYNVGGSGTSPALQQGAGSFKDLFSGLSVRDSTPPSFASPFSPSAAVAAASRKPEPTYVPFFFLRGCQPSAHCTLVLRGSRSLSILHRLQRVVQLCVHIAYNLSLEQTLLFEMGVTYTAHSLAAMEQKATQNIDQARVAMQAVDEGGGPPQYMTLISSSPHITLPPIPFYPSLLNQQANFSLPISPHLQQSAPAPSSAYNNSARPPTHPSSQPPPLQHAATWSQPATRDLLNFPTPTHRDAPAQPPFDPSALHFSELAPPICTALLQSNLLVGSCWFVSSPLTGQCRAPDLKTIDFYTMSDKTLAGWLIANCFDVDARCINHPTCKKDIFRHTLAYTHNDGRLLITVRQRRPEGGVEGTGDLSGLPSPAPPMRSTSSPSIAAPAGDIQRTMSPQPPSGGQGSPPPSLQYSPTSTPRGLPLPAPPVLQVNKHSQPPGSRGSVTVTHAHTPNPHPFSFNSQATQPSPSSAMQQQQQQQFAQQQSQNSPGLHPSTNPANAPPTGFSSNTFITWSRCKVCNHRVTPYTPLSPASLSYSFGKYLDLIFNDLSAMSTCASCPHPVHTAHTRFIAIGNVVACFDYEKAQPFAVVARPRVKYDRSEVMEGRLVHLSTLAMVSRQVFDEFLQKIGEIEANSRSAAFKDLLQQLHAKVKHEEDNFTALYKRHGLKVSMLDNLAALNMSAEKNNAALVQSLVEGGVDDEATALFGDEKSPTGEERPREQRPLLDTFDIHRLHRKLVLSFIEWNKMLTEMCSFIFPKGWEDSEANTAGGMAGALAGAGTEERKERSGDVLQINIERSAHRLPPAPTPFNRDTAGSPSGSTYIRQPGSPSLPFSTSKEPLTPTLFSSLHSSAATTTTPPQPFSGGFQSAVSPNGPRSRNDSGQSGPILDTAQFKSMLSNMSDMFGGGGARQKPIRRSFKPNVTADDLAEHNPRLKDIVTELVASPLSHGHFSLPHCVGSITVPVFDDEPSSIIAYTLASFEHLQLVNPSKVDEMKQQERDRAAADAERQQQQQQQQQQQSSGAAAHTNGRAAAARPTSGEINFFDDAVHIGQDDSGLLVIDHFANPTPATGSTDMFDLMSFGSPPIAAAAPVQLSAVPTNLYKPSPFSFASPAPTNASPLAAAVQQSASQYPPSGADNHRAKLLGAVGPRSSISSALYVHPHSMWFSSDRPEKEVEALLLSGFTDSREEPLKFKFEDVLHHTQQPSDALCQFKCVAYCPRQFHALRSHTCNGDYDFIQSMSRSDKWATTGGKSGSTFSKTSDDRYVLKYVKKLELDMFLDLAQHYFHYMAKVCFKNTPSVLVKILGVYTLSWQRGKKEGMSALHVIVMPNLFYQKTNVRVFDLKGSERNRYIKQAAPSVAQTAGAQLPPLPNSNSGSQSSLAVQSGNPTSASPPPPSAAPAESTSTLLDLNLWEYTHGLPIPVHESSQQLLKMCLTGDHRVLTRRGWRSIAYVDVGDEVLSLNFAADRTGGRTYHMEWKRVTDRTSHAVTSRQRDELFRMEGSGMDVIATHDHNMLVARIGAASKYGPAGLQKRLPMEMVTVAECREFSYRPSTLSTRARFQHCDMRSVVCAGDNIQPHTQICIPGLERECERWWRRDHQLDFLRFLGFWLGDGYLDVTDGDVHINQAKVRHMERLDELLDRVFPGGWSSRPWVTRPGQTVYTIKSLPLYNYLRCMAVGPAGYNPRDPTALRHYPHFVPAAGLADEERKSAYYTSSFDSPPIVTAAPVQPTASSSSSGGSHSRSSAVDLTGNSHTRFRFTPRGRSVSVSSTESLEQAVAAAGIHTASTDGSDSESAADTAMLDDEPCCLLCGGTNGLSEFDDDCHYCTDCPAALTDHEHIAWDEDESMNDDVIDLTGEGAEDEQEDDGCYDPLFHSLAQQLPLDAADASEGNNPLCATAPKRTLRAHRPVVNTRHRQGSPAMLLSPPDCHMSAPQSPVSASQVDVADPASVQGMRAAGAVVWWNGGEWIIINAHWFYLKRWLGDAEQVHDVWSQLSRRQAIALLDGFCRADGTFDSVRYDDAHGEPTGSWQCSSSSMPLIDHLMLIAQLAGAAVSLALHSRAGTVRVIEGRTATQSVDHWRLLFHFTRSERDIPGCLQLAPLAEPVSVADDVGARGYYDYQDDGRVYCITVDGNHNFLTQRLSSRRLQSGVHAMGVRANSLFVGNCLHNDSFFLSGREVIDYSLLVGFDHANGEVLVGVIDYIRKYTLDKRLETGMKSMGRIVGQAVPTVIDPTAYKQRFRAAMERFFMIAPDQCSWFRKVQEREEESIPSYALREEQEVENSRRAARNNNSNSSGGGAGNNERPPMERPPSTSQGVFSNWRR